jgi:AraC-like DNA-binding protein
VTTVASEWARWPRLAEELREAPSWQQRAGLVDWFLLERLETGPRPSPEVAWTWRRLLASGGGIPIGRLAAEAGWSHKHLITRFRQQMGLRPKTAARLIRFDRVWRRLAQSEGPPVWADLAHEAGYADQAHLIREFRRFTGMTPTQFQAQTPRPTATADRRSIPLKMRSPPLPTLAEAGPRYRQGGAMHRRSGPFWDGVEGRAPIPPAAGDAGLRVSSSQPSISI